jgi:flagellar biogenesis protein FliO
MKKTAIVFYLFFFSPLFAFANQELNLPASTTDAINLTEGTTSIGLLLVRYLIAVIFVVSLLYFTLKYIGHKNEPKYKEGNWVNVLDYNYMGNNRGLYLVEISNQGYVIGSTENSMNLLTKLEEQEFEKIKNEIILNKEFSEFTINPFKKRKKNLSRTILNKILKLLKSILIRKEISMNKKIISLLIMLVIFSIVIPGVYAQEFTIPGIELGLTNATEPQDVALSLQIVFLLTILTLAPGILILMTSLLELL